MLYQVVVILEKFKNHLNGRINFLPWYMLIMYYVKWVVFILDICIVTLESFENHVNALNYFEPLPLLLSPVRLYKLNMVVSLYCHVPSLSTYLSYYFSPNRVCPINFDFSQYILITFPCTPHNYSDLNQRFSHISWFLYVSAYSLLALNQPTNSFAFYLYNSGILPEYFLCLLYKLRVHYAPPPPLAYKRFNNITASLPVWHIFFKLRVFFFKLSKHQTLEPIN